MVDLLSFGTAILIELRKQRGQNLENEKQGFNTWPESWCDEEPENKYAWTCFKAEASRVNELKPIDIQAIASTFSFKALQEFDLQHCHEAGFNEIQQIIQDGFYSLGLGYDEDEQILHAIVLVGTPTT